MNGPARFVDSPAFERVKAAFGAHADALAAIVADDAIAVLVIDPKEPALAALDEMGWTGEPVLRLPQRVKRRMERHDHVTRRWLRRRNGPGRVLVVCDHGSLLVNVELGVGMSIEPGSTDAGTLN